MDIPQIVIRKNNAKVMRRKWKGKIIKKTTMEHIIRGNKYQIYTTRYHRKERSIERDKSANSASFLRNDRHVRKKATKL